MRRSPSLILLMLLGCHPALPIPSGNLLVSLDGTWEGVAGRMPIPSRDHSSSIIVKHGLALPEGWRRSTRAVLRANATGWRVEAFLGGESVGTDVGGLRPIAIDLTGHLHGGEQQLTLSVEGSQPDNVFPGQVIPFPATWSYNQPRAGEVGLMGEIWLEIAAKRRFDDLTVTFADGALSARARVSGADGERVTFSVVRDGSELARFPAARVENGEATAEVAWDGPRWKIGGSDAPFLQYLVASLPSGEARHLRFGARELARNDRKLVLNGTETYLVVERFLGGAEDARVAVGEVAAVYAAAGLNAMELHAMMHSDSVLAAADELGLPVVITPICDGQRRWGGESPLSPEWADFQAESNTRVVLSHRDHPSMMLWNLEADRELPFPEAYDPYRTSVIPAVDMTENIGYSDEAFYMWRSESPLPVYVTELALHTPVYEGLTILQRVEQLLLAHRHVGIGLTIPNELTGHLPADRTQAVDATPQRVEVRDMLARSQVSPFTTGVRRGPATVIVTVSRAGLPVNGGVVLLRAPGQAMVAAATDFDGRATLMIDYAGAAEVGVWGGQAWTPIELATGHYKGGRWMPHVTEAALDVD